MSDYLDLHLEVARYFEKPETTRMCKALKLLYNHPPEIGFMLLHSFPRHMFPFATEENWNEYGREVVDQEDGAVVFTHPMTGEERTLYSIQVTEGEPLPHFPTNNNPPELNQETFDQIYRWVLGMMKMDGIRIHNEPYMRSGGGYEKSRKAIIVPGLAPKELVLQILLHSYIYSLEIRDFESMDEDDLREYHGTVDTVVYKLFKDRGYDMGEYGLARIAIDVETYNKYLEIEENIETLLNYFNDSEINLELLEENNEEHNHQA
jgi:hypothetical protein